MYIRYKELTSSCTREISLKKRSHAGQSLHSQHCSINRGSSSILSFSYSHAKKVFIFQIIPGQEEKRNVGRIVY